MKRHITKWFLIAFGAAILQGCVAIPPLIQVQHKDNNDEIARRLDSIDRRLDRLEQKPADKAETR